MFLYKRIQGALRAILQNDIIMILFLYGLIALYNIRVIELLMDRNFLFQ